ncbi:MAG: aminoacyl-tRNA hydrolase [Alphaproteobacteria bacterium]
MFLLVGLGNYGNEYLTTKHNYGFLLIDKIIARYKFIKQKNKFQSEFFLGSITDKKIIAIKPQTYMNLSGKAVIEIQNFYKISNENIWVFHDDLDIEFRKIKYKIGGGNAGHNGLKSIDQTISNNYHRLRLGIGRPLNPNYEISDYVLSKFLPNELEEIDKINDLIAENFHLLLENKINEFYDKINIQK